MKKKIAIDEMLRDEKAQDPFCFIAEFTCEEMDSLEKAIDDPKTDKITVREYYEHFKINPDEYFRLKKSKDWVFKQDYSLEHLIPKQVVELAESKIDYERKRMLLAYNIYFKSQPAPKNIRDELNKLKELFYDALVCFFSLGEIEMKRLSEDEINEIIDEKSFNIRMQMMKKDIARQALCQYFSVEETYTSPPSDHVEKIRNCVKALQALEKKGAAAYKPKASGNLN